VKPAGSGDERAHEGAGGPGSGREEQGAASGRRYKILVVDDSALILRMTSVMLEAHGFEVITCDSPVVAGLRAGTERPDLVLVDLDLGDVSGERVVAAIKNGPRTAHLRVYLYTATEVATLDETVRRSRADGVIPKGSDGAALARAVRRALGHRTG
jgi:CheY-like chemotaxis protein